MKDRKEVFIKIGLSILSLALALITAFVSNS